MQSMGVSLWVCVCVGGGVLTRFTAVYVCVCVVDSVMQLLQHHLLSEKHEPYALFGRQPLTETCACIFCLNDEHIPQLEVGGCVRASFGIKTLAPLCSICRVN